MMTSTLYERIGQAFIEEAISEFYRRAFRDPIIGHFFFNHDLHDLTMKQITFAARMLGAKHIRYTGAPLKTAHSALPLTRTHFRRRQVLMAEVLQEHHLAADLSQAWLELEEGLQGLIINSSRNCKS